MAITTDQSVLSGIFSGHTELQRATQRLADTISLIPDMTRGGLFPGSHDDAIDFESLRRKLIELIDLTHSHAMRYRNRANYLRKVNLPHPQEQPHEKRSTPHQNSYPSRPEMECRIR